MTGEITLSGQVLPIGGLREKALAAQRAGIKKVIFPRENESDLEELPEETRKEIEFVPWTRSKRSSRSLRRLPPSRCDPARAHARAQGRGFSLGRPCLRARRAG